MKKLYLILVATMLLIPLLSKADDEVIWETEKIPYLHDVLVAPQGDILYNISGKTLQIRRISDGVKIDSIEFDSIPNYLYHMSISADGRYMAFIGDNPFVLIYDLFERKEVKRITALVYVQNINGKDTEFYAQDWTSVSISPDGTKITGIAHTSAIYTKTNFLVIDIATEKILSEERRIVYDAVISPNRSFEWKSAEYSPDNKYIVAQLDYGHDGEHGADTVLKVRLKYIADDSSTGQIKFSTKPYDTQNNNDSLFGYSGNGIQFRGLAKQEQSQAHLPTLIIQK